MLVLSRNLPLAAAEDGPFLLGKSIAPFSLIDYRGKAHSLDDYQSSPVLVLAVLGTECPLAKQYSLKLQKLAESYAGQG
ncbi:MAG TPA: hypothetical protein VGE80_23990, partial [Schlesneria sp.]